MSPVSLRVAAGAFLGCVMLIAHASSEFRSAAEPSTQNAMAASTIVAAARANDTATLTAARPGSANGRRRQVSARIRPHTSVQWSESVPSLHDERSLVVSAQLDSGLSNPDSTRLVPRIRPSYEFVNQISTELPPPMRAQFFSCVSDPTAQRRACLTTIGRVRAMIARRREPIGEDMHDSTNAGAWEEIQGRGYVR